MQRILGYACAACAGCVIEVVRVLGDIYETILGFPCDPSVQAIGKLYHIATHHSMFVSLFMIDVAVDA